MRSTKQQQRPSAQKEGGKKNLISSCLKEQKEKKKKIELPTNDDDWENVDANQQDEKYEQCESMHKNLTSIICNQDEETDCSTQEMTVLNSRNDNMMNDEETIESVGTMYDSSFNTRTHANYDNNNK